MTRPSKLPDWRLRLRAYLAEADRPFEWGTHDCGAFAGGAVAAMTGANPHDEVAGRYRTARGAARALRRAGYGDHIALAAAHLDEVAPKAARFGDIAMVDGEGGPALGVVTGAHIAVLTPQGRGVVPLSEAKRVFRA